VLCRTLFFLVLRAFVLLFFCSFYTVAFAEVGSNKEFTPSYNDFGATGLLQTPNARFAEDGKMNLGVSVVKPYQRAFLNIQALPWLEMGFRLTQITNRIEIGSLQFNKQQSFYDRGIDVKLRLFQETASTPQVAIGLRDIGGTGLFSSEYFAFSKRYYNWDFTTGVAWGNLGTRGQFKNPVGFLSESFKTRQGTSTAGQFSNTFFRGENIGLFGGVEYITPIKGVRLKMELDGNDYQSEPLNNPQQVSSPLNVAAEYRPVNWVNVSVGAERGNTIMARLSFSASLKDKTTLPKLDKDLVPLAPRPPARVLRETTLEESTLRKPCTPAENKNFDVKLVRIEGQTYTIKTALHCRPADDVLKAKIAALLPKNKNVNVAVEGASPTHQGSAPLTPAIILPSSGMIGTVYDDLVNEYATQKPLQQAAQQKTATATTDMLEKNGFAVTAVEEDHHTMRVWVSEGTFPERPKAIGRAARIVANNAPANVEKIQIITEDAGMRTSSVTLPRTQLEHAMQGKASAAELWYGAEVTNDAPAPLENATYNTTRYPALSWGIGPGYRQSFGGPDQYYSYQVYADIGASVEWARGLSTSLHYAQDIRNNFDGIKLESGSPLPNVRSGIKNYLQQGASGITSLDTSFTRNLAPNWYGQVTGGLLEQMFGGAGAEVLYAPFTKPWAVGGNFFWVRQRGFDGKFDFLPYHTTTGHLAVYYKLPYYDLTAKVSTGRYLAGDDGQTYDLSRTFASGVTVGVFATRTDVPAEKFGEGSFDKGFYVTIPLDLFYLKSTRRTGTFAFRPVTRDGGARLGAGESLYDAVDQYRKHPLQSKWGKLLE
jgi:hypothetical protein